MSVKLSASVGIEGVMVPPQEIVQEDAEKRTLRKYTLEERSTAVIRVLKGEKKSHVARSIGVTESTVRGWVSTWKTQGRLPGSGESRGKKKATKKQVELPATVEKVELPAAAAPVVVQYVMQYQYPVMLLAPLVPVVTPYYQVISVGVPTPMIVQSKIAPTGVQAPKIMEDKVTPPAPKFEDAQTPISTSSVPKERIEEVSSVKSDTKERVEASSDAEAKPKVTQNDAASVSPTPTPNARRHRGRPRTSTSSPSAQRKSIGQASSLEGATKRKLEKPSVPEPKRARLSTCRTSKRLVLQDERRRQEELLNQPEVACRFEDFFEALDLMRRPNPGRLAPAA